VGFNPSSLLQVSIDTRGSGYAQGQVGAVYRLLLNRLSAIPGVVSVTAVRNRVMQGGMMRARFPIPGRALDPDESWQAAEVGPSFFETMGIPVLRGRAFTADDYAHERRVVAVSEAFVRRYFPDEDPLGKRIGEPRDGMREIIAVVKDATLNAVRQDPEPFMYFIAPKEPNRFDALEVRAAANTDAIARAIRQEVQRIHPRLLVDIATMQHHIDRSIAKERMVAATSAFFSLFGLLLAAIGIFGVASYTVAQRTNELGIRIALGAGRWRVVRESLRETMWVFSIGLAAGVAAAAAAIRLTTSLISDLLFGVTPTDAANIGIAVLVLAAVALAACVFPARHATRIDPLTAIRYE
jgi:predicted permease